MTKQERALSVHTFEGFGQVAGCAGMAFGFMFGSMFFGIGAIFFFMLAIHPLLSIWGSADWVETPCVITRSEVIGRDTFRIEVDFDYEFDGQKFYGNRFKFGDMSTNGRAAHQRQAARYKVGSEQVCYVNPRNPAESVLLRESSISLWWGLFPVPFMLIGLGTYWYIFSGRFKFRPFASLVDMQQKMHNIENQPREFTELEAVRHVKTSEWRDSDYDEEDLYEEPGPVTLDPESSRWGIVIFLFFFGLLWNGVVSGFAFSRLNDWMQFKIHWFEDLFLVPFILVGIGVVIAWVYSFMAALNPRPTLVLNRQLIPLGGTADVQWKFEDLPNAIRGLTIKLKGEESAQYRRGTSTYTDTHTFYEEVLYETHDRLDMQNGQAQIDIPGHLMHTFHGGNNQIKWGIVLHGDIALWPDISVTFPIRVVPHE